MFEDRYARLLKRFMSDNPSLELEDAKRNLDELLLEKPDLYTNDNKAEMSAYLLEQALEAKTPEEQKELLEEASLVYEYAFEPRAMLVCMFETNLDTILEKTEQIREEWKKYLISNCNLDIDKDFSCGLVDDNYLDNHNELFGYFRLVYKLIEFNEVKNDFNTARKYAEMLVRFDHKERFHSSFNYAIILGCLDHYNLGFKILSSKKSEEYSYLRFLYYLADSDYDAAYMQMCSLADNNPYYPAFITNIIDTASFATIYKYFSYDELFFETSGVFVLALKLFLHVKPKLDNYLITYGERTRQLAMNIGDAEISILYALSFGCKIGSGMTKDEIEADITNTSKQLSLEEIPESALDEAFTFLFNHKFISKFNDLITLNAIGLYVVKYFEDRHNRNSQNTPNE